MNSFVYRFYMRDEMILKTVIFASAFGLVIDSFKTAKEKEIYKFSFFILLAVFFNIRSIFFGPVPRAAISTWVFLSNQSKYSLKYRLK